MKQLKAHFQRILDTGAPKPNRKGEFDQPDSTLSVFGAQLRFDLSKGQLPVTTSKELKFDAMAKEIAWMIRGETNIKTLGCSIWNKWALKEDLVIKQPKHETDIIREMAVKFPEHTVPEISQMLFGMVIEACTIAEGTMIRVNAAVGEGDQAEQWEEVPLTPELLTPQNINMEGVTVDYELIDNTLLDQGVNPYNIIPQFDAGYCGPIYGQQWRAFESIAKRQGQKGIVVTDQLMEAYRTLRDDIYSRRNLVMAWNPGLITESGTDLQTNIALGNMGLPPCHYGFQLYVAGRPEEQQLSLGLKLRSSDSGVGLPFNITAYSFMAYLYAAEFDLKLGEMVADIGDAHIYISHIDGVHEYIKRSEHELPKFTFTEKYAELKERVCKQALVNYVDQLTYQTPEQREVALAKEFDKYFHVDIVNTPAAKEALFKLFIDNLDYTVITECIEGYTSEGFIKLDLYD